MNAIPAPDAKTSERPSVLRILGYAVFFVVAFLFFSYKTFPYHKLRDYIVDRVQFDHVGGRARPTGRNGAVPLSSPRSRANDGGDHGDCEHGAHDRIRQGHVGVAPVPRLGDAGLHDAPYIEDAQHEPHARGSERHQPASVETDGYVHLGRRAVHVASLVRRRVPMMAHPMTPLTRPAYGQRAGSASTVSPGMSLAAE